MDEQLRDRLLGLVILVALAVIVLPLVFDGDGDYAITPVEPLVERPQAGPTETLEIDPLLRSETPPVTVYDPALESFR